MTEKIVSFLLERLNPEVIYLFGSLAVGAELPDSDVDLALLCRRAVDGKLLFLTQLELAVEIDRDVDLVDLMAADPVFQAQVLSKGVILYCRDEQRRLQAEIRMMKDYQMFNFSRKAIIVSKYGEALWKSL